jgi:PAS domain S-box-containing protein
MILVPELIYRREVMFFIIRFIIVWIIWMLFADKKRWRELFLVALFGGFLGLITDILVLANFKLWAYHDSFIWRAYLLDDLGIYMVTIYLFIQWLPKQKTFSRMFFYWFLWSGFCLGIEWIHLFTNNMSHYKWWNLGWSYLFGWFLFWLFYQFHKIFRLEKLNYTEEHIFHQNAENFYLASESSPLPIIGLDTTNSVIIWNSSAERIFGWKKQEVIGYSVPIIPIEEQDKFFLMVKAKLQGKTFHNMKLRFQKKNGSIFNSIYSTGPIRNKKGSIVGTMAIITDFPTAAEIEENSITI